MEVKAPLRNKNDVFKFQESAKMAAFIYTEKRKGGVTAPQKKSGGCQREA